MTVPALAFVALQRWTAQAISAFGRDAGFPFAGAIEAERVAERTGGWDFLIDQVATGVAGATTLAAVLDEARVADLRARIGFENDSVVTAAFDLARTLVMGPETACELPTLASFFDDSPEVSEALRKATARDKLPDGATGASVAQQLVLAALLNAGPGGNVWVEPVAAQALSQD